MNPIPGAIEYKSWWTDITDFSPETYAKYAMLLRDFYVEEIQENFNKWFTTFDVKKVRPSIQNPNKYMEARREKVQELIEKYRNTTSPLEFYGSIHMAEGVALLLDVLKNPELKGGIIADEQGMAKTIQAIIAAREFGIERTLVVAPKTARVTTWPDELFLVDPKLGYKLLSPANFQGGAPFDLIQWDALRRMPDKFFEQLKKKYQLTVADEYHRIKHATSQRSVAFDRVVKPIPKLIGLTGTLATKRPKDLYNPLRLIEHPLAKNEWKFLTRYCGEKDRNGGWDFSKAKNLNELHGLLGDCYIRREKSQTNLPEKIRYVKKVHLTESQRAAYDRAWPEYMEKNIFKIQGAGFPLKMVKYGIERGAIALAKVPAVIEWAEELLEAGEKVCIYTGSTEVFDAYMKHFGKIAVGINGKVTDEVRVHAKNQFQKNPDIKVFIGNIIAAGESITLTAASYLAFNDFNWLPTDQLQAEDRIHRGGQMFTCSIYYFICPDTVEEETFADFLRSKDVVQQINNRRTGDGKIKDAQWAGDLAGTGLENKKAGELVKEDWDWEDAGEEPPPGWLPPRDTMMGRNISKRDGIVYQQLRHIMTNGGFYTWDKTFGESLIRFYEEKGFLTDRQQDTADRMLGKYVAKLVSFRPRT
jgi:SWI/SNF-related matrix-associated actin-dependent regulator 1 of chromatin subfamily A